jgi:ubiquinone/menaquinone biosynthesis C-methylase UbiE
MMTIIKNLLQKTSSPPLKLNVVEAYNFWSDSYDRQPGNLMLDLDEVLFAELIKEIDLKNKRIADIGCGTGRHWPKIYEKKPAIVMGFDVSAGMLQQLIRKFPSAVTQLTTDNLLKNVPDLFADCLVTTLTIAHIKNINEAIASWSRVLKNGGDLVITDFHPSMLAKGGKRSFRHGARNLSVINHIHPLDKVKNAFRKYGLTVVNEVERNVNEEVRPYYEAQNALPVYNRFKGLPIIYGLHLKKHCAAE